MSTNFAEIAPPRQYRSDADDPVAEDRLLTGHFFGGLARVASFVVDLEGRLLDASDSTVHSLGLGKPADWRNQLWCSALPSSSRELTDKWHARDPESPRVILCHLRSTGVTGDALVAICEKLAEQEVYSVTVDCYSLALSPPLFDRTKSGLRFEAAFLSIPDQSVAWVRHDSQGTPITDARIDSWESWMSRALPDDRHSLENRLQQLVDGTKTLVTQKFRAQSATGQLESIKSQFFAVLRDASGKAVLIKAVTRVTSGASKGAVSLHLGRHLLEHVQESVVATDLNGTIHFWGRGAERLYGWRADEVIGRSVSLIVSEPDHPAEYERLRKVLSKGVWRGRYRQVRKDGSSFMASTQISIVEDDEGQPIGFVGIDNDISEWFDQQRKITEIQASLASAQWITIRGELLAGCCHELCQPVFAIQNFINAISRAIASNAEQDYVQKLLTMCSQEITRASEISANLREYAKHPQLKKYPCRVSKLLDDCNSIGRIHAELVGIEFKFEHLANDAQVLCDEIQLRHVLINLIRNAFDALSDCELTVRRVILRSEVRDDTVVISVIDNGNGVPEHLKDSIFKPFFTTKKSGTGVGLPMCRSITESHHGTLVLAKSQLNAGATFEATLPLLPTQDETPQDSPTETSGAAPDEFFSVG